MAKEQRSVEDLSLWQETHKLISKAKSENIETVWDRLEKQEPHCTFCDQGLSCAKCVMGPCRVSTKQNKLGVCGADADLTVARNFGRFVAAGAASHSDHGRDLVEVLHAIGTGETKDYIIRDENKLRAIAKELGVTEAEKSVKEVALALADLFFKDYSSNNHALSFLKRLPKLRLDLWNKLGVAPRGIDREVVEMMHRTHMGVDCDPVSLALHSARVALSDGWGGSMIGTEISDMIFGTPSPKMSQVNLGVLKTDQVNILVHGHSPVVSEMILQAVKEPAALEKAKKYGAKGINVGGLCCTGNELLMRQGIPLAGNHLMTELAIVTGAVEMIVADYQCIMPSLVTIAACYHTKFVSTSNKAHFPGATHLDFSFTNALDQARIAVDMAIEAYAKRNPAKVFIPVEPMNIMTGFSNEAIIGALGGTPKPLIDAIVAGQVRGAVGIVGCNNPKQKQDFVHVELAKELIKKNILILVTGCATSAMGKAGLLVPEAAELAGDGLKAVCKSLGIPPVLHVGSCVDNSRIIHLCAVLANALGVDISALPVAASAPEWYSEKAAAIGLYAVASGIHTHLGLPPNITGSEMFTNLALNGLTDVFGAAFSVEPDPYKAAELIDNHIKLKRKGLGLSE